MKRIAIILLLILQHLEVFSTVPLDKLLAGLDKEIEKKDSYIYNKRHTIVALKKQLEHIKKDDLDNQFLLLNKLYQEFQSLNSDTAFIYAENMLRIAYAKNENSKITISKINISFLLVTSGMFNEALDTLNTIRLNNLPDSIMYEYYNTTARLYLDKAGFYVDKRYSVKYDTIANHFIDLAIKFCKPNSYNYNYNYGLKYLKNNEFDLSFKLFEKIAKEGKPDSHQFAESASCLAYICLKRGDTLNASSWLIAAAKADIIACVKENVALTNLAEILYKNGNIKESYHYIKISLDDAIYYGTRYRQRQIMSILPMIASLELVVTEQQKKNYFVFTLALGGLSLLIIVFLMIILTHYKKLKTAKAEISKSNSKLQEANNIKEEYIGYFFNTISQYIDKIDKFKKAINRKLTVKRIEDIEMIINNINPNEEREALFESFDRVFLKLFPGFVKNFNSLLRPDEQIILRNNKLLSTDLRIYALIRLGISDSEKIARILGVSVNTIYNYKTKIRNKSIVPNELFEKKVMEIKGI